MASQPTSGDQLVTIAAAGTTVSSDTATTLRRVLIAGTYVGSVEFYDSATAAGTAAGNLLYNVGIPALNIHRNIDVFARTRNGLVVVATGTPTLFYTKD